MPRASCRSSVMAAFVEVCASAISAFAASGSVSIFCCARPSVMPTETSRGWTPSCRSRSMRVRSTSAARTAPARWALDVRAASASCASREGTMMARARTPCRMREPDDRRRARATAARMPTGTAQETGHLDAGAGEPRPCSPCRVQRREGQHDTGGEDAEEHDDDPAEDRGDREARDAAPARGSIACSHRVRQAAAEARARPLERRRRGGRPKP